MDSIKETIWLTYNGRVLECLHTSAVESCRIESRPTSLTESRVLMSHVSFLSVGRDGCYFALGIECRGVDSRI
jgi:hypothetical protein